MSDSISSIASALNGAALSNMSRPPETTPDARETAAQENDARRQAEAVSGAAPATLVGQASSASTALQGPEEASASVGTRVNVVPASNSTTNTIEQSARQISRSYAEGQPSAAEMRAASEAYQAESQAASQQAVQQQQQGGVRATDITV